MPIKVKICGLTDAPAVEAAIENGASYGGFVFFPPSPRHLVLKKARKLTSLAGNDLKKVGVFVDPDDETLGRILEQVSLDFIQLHGRETPERVQGVREKFKTPVIKAAGIKEKADLGGIDKFLEVSDQLLFDAKPKKDDTRPGGLARGFNHDLLKGLSIKKPWFLSGGLRIKNIREAVRKSGAPQVDVSSGVEQNPGKKDPHLIAAFMKEIRRLEK